MSGASSRAGDPATGSSATGSSATGGSATGGSAFGTSPLEMATGPIRFVGFWAAVALPFLYVPLLWGGLSGSQTIAFGALLAGNLLALIVGHGHRQ